MSDGSIPNPLAFTAEGFVAACKAAPASGNGGRPLARPGALERYAAAFREGVRVPGLVVAPIVREAREDVAEGTVVKFVQRLDQPGDVPDPRIEHLDIESVLIPMIGRTGRKTFTLCVSSQVGCAMGCTFCETAQMGLIRSLTPAEIVGQWWTATHVLGHSVSNIVFMGMGEPMDNLDNVLAAIATLKDHLGAAFPISKITISTVGRVDGIRTLAAKINEPGWHRLNLAISLNAPDDAIRDRIQPVNRKYKLAELQAALIDFPVYGGGKLCMEYVLLPGENDSEQHAQQIAAFLAPINARYNENREKISPRTMVNVIPYNPRRDSPWPAPTEESVDRFMGWLGALGVYAKRRRTKGRDLMGACGQLGTAEIRKRKVVTLTTSAREQT
ncbi:MAG: 23S rRNA (adenine(2503)-C(2))-methyltransferase RlmN [Planctomycetota bacterium]|nr:23S rRNA (adenine(2503)-C(2))-methyltransferase RlmN [Planctomycetota bacterium]